MIYSLENFKDFRDFIEFIRKYVIYRRILILLATIRIWCRLDFCRDVFERASGRTLEIDAHSHPSPAISLRHGCTYSRHVDAESRGGKPEWRSRSRDDRRKGCASVRKIDSPVCKIPVYVRSPVTSRWRTRFIPASERRQQVRPRLYDPPTSPYQSGEECEFSV